LGFCSGKGHGGIPFLGSKYAEICRRKRKEQLACQG
jgi:hypothetical protein